MTAPALVLLAEGSDEPSVAQVALSLRKLMQELRPSLSISVAFAGQGGPTASQVITALATRGVDEVVLVPLDITHAVTPPESISDVVQQARLAHPGVRTCLARPIGPACELLSILDMRLREALSLAHTRELDGLVLLAPDSGDPRGAALLARRARQWRAHHKLPVQLAFGNQPGHGLGTAITSLRGQGRRLIAVGSFYLAPERQFAEQAEYAVAHGAIAVGAPIGADERLLDLAMARYSVSALELLDAVPEEACPPAATDPDEVAALA